MEYAVTTYSVEVENVSKKYGSLYALKNLSMRIEDGVSLAVLGPNGAGKSTLLRIVATHASPSSGSVRIFGADAFKKSEAVRRQIGFVSHQSFLYDELTIEENLAFYRRMFSTARKNLVSDRETVELLNLTDWYGVQVNRLSHGLRKRADIARALVHDPPLILLDEPFSGLDEDTREFLLGYLRGQDEKNVILTTHSSEWARQVCDRGIRLENGKATGELAF